MKRLTRAHIMYRCNLMERFQMISKNNKFTMHFSKKSLMEKILKFTDKIYLFNVFCIILFFGKTAIGTPIGISLISAALSQT